MTDKSSVIFGNPISKKAIKKAAKSKKKFAKKYGDDSAADYKVKLVPNVILNEPLGVYDIRVDEGEGDLPFDTEKGIIVGNIRMGFGHYRISIAMASAAHALGYTPYWMDLNSYPTTTCTKVISAQNDLYSMGSRLSQKSKLFNKKYWEPLNYEGFRQLTYNAGDQKNAELMAPVYRNVPKEIPVIGTHVWPAQAAIHAGMQHVVNAIPDNWPMALHFAEGSVHTIQTHQSYIGYRILNGMQEKDVLKPMPAESLVYTGHYIDHELVANLEADCDGRRFMSTSVITRRSGKRSARESRGLRTSAPSISTTGRTPIPSRLRQLTAMWRAYTPSGTRTSSRQCTAPICSCVPPTCLSPSRASWRSTRFPSSSSRESAVTRSGVRFTRRRSATARWNVRTCRTPCRCSTCS